MAWTQSDVDALKAVIGTGILSVTYDGPPKRVVVYQSTNAMRIALADMVAEVNNAAGTRVPYRYVKTSKGF